MENTLAQKIKFDVKIKNNYDYVSYQCETYYRSLYYIQKQNPYSLIEEIYLENNGEIDLYDLRLVFKFSNEIISVSDVLISALLAGSKTKITEYIYTKIDVNTLIKLSEGLATNLEVSLVNNSNEIICSKIYDILLHPMNESIQVALDYSMLACFVTPNAYLVKKIINKAVEKLKNIRKNYSFVGYQANDVESVREEMKAIFDALHSYGIVYANPPASFNHFQKVRIPTEVLTEYRGTCLDLSLLYCACLENVGLNPILIIIHGHAFVGCFLEENSFILNECNDVGRVYNDSAIGNLKIELVESTLFNIASSNNFNEATKIARNHLAFYNGPFSGIDIVKCHRGVYRPIPMIEEDGGDLKIDIDFDLKDTKLEKKVVTNNGVIFEKEDINNGKFNHWAKKLLDLGLRNRLINFRVGLSSPQVFTRSALNFLDTILEKDNIWLYPLNSEKKDNVLYTNFSKEIENYAKKDIYGITCDEVQLRKIFRKATSALEETGSNVLYLGVGLINFIPKKSKKNFIAPIFLIPVKGKSKRGISGYELIVDNDGLTINTTLLEYLKQNFKISLDELYKIDKANLNGNSLAIFNLIRSKSCDECTISVDDEKVFLSIFSFSHYIMWDDIKNRKDELLKNEIIRNLVDGISYKYNDEKNITCEEIDEVIDINDYAIPLGADSSQLKAIIDCNNNKSFVLDGPPGTGKSQTIVNMIANALYNGKSVLFVAEKMAALEVVKKRLDDINLGSFCLELHSNKANKKNFIEQIEKALDNERTKAPDSIKTHANEVVNKQKDLNMLIKKTREKKYFLSLYDCIIKYQALIDYNKNIIDEDRICINYNEKMINEIIDLINSIQSLCEKRGEYKDNHFYAFLIDNYIFNQSSALKNSLNLLSDSIISIGKKFNEFSQQLPDEIVFSRHNIDLILEIMDLIYHHELTFNTLHSNEIYKHDKQNKEVLRKGIEVNQISSELKVNLNDDIFNYDSITKSALLQSVEHKKLKTFFVKRKIIKEIRKFLKNKKQKIKKDEFFVIINKLNVYKDNLLLISKNNNFLTKLFKDGYNELTNNFLLMSELYENTLNCKILIDKVSFLDSEDKIDFIASLKKIKVNISEDDIADYRIQELLNDYNKVRENEIELSNTYKYDYSLLRFDSNEDYFVYYKNTIDDMISNIKQIEDISALNRIINSLVNYNVNEQLINELKLGIINSKDFDKYFLEYIYFNLIQEYFKDPYYNEFNGLLFNQAIKKYNALLEEYSILVIKEIASRVTKKFPVKNMNYAPSTITYRFQKCIKNNGVKTTIRNMINDFEDIIRQICPCFLMSPISAAQYLSVKSKKFDIIIFDEASQIPTSEAVGAISRGRNLIVAGDPEQMPPSNFFKSNIIDDDIVEYEENNDDLENLLDDCLALGLPRNRLLWHYRSQHESLIAFSNNTFYNRSLYTFPSPDNEVSRVEYYYIENAIYDAGINKREAESILKEVKRRFSDAYLCRQSIGIVTFNIKQQELILDMINDLFDKNPEFAKINEENHDKLFVKNLENVQGDERDIIIFSIGFGYTSEKKFNLYFGPLSLEKGERRLNVAVTRARINMLVFTSIKSLEIDPSKAKNRGALVLKQFLQYAEKGMDSIIVENANQYIIKPGIEKFLQEDLKNLGYESDINVGDSKFKIDLCVKNKTGKYILGVICDSATYANSPTCRDRNCVQDRMLNRLNWKIIRIYTIDYLTNKENVIEDIIGAIKSSNKLDIERANSKKEAIVFEKEEVKINKNAIPYVKYTPLNKYDYETCIEGYRYKELIKELENCIDFEGPISEILLLERFKQILSITKAGSRVRRIFETNIEYINRTKIMDINSYIYYPKNKNRNDIKYYRLSTQEERDIELIPSCEIVTVLIETLELQESISISDIIRILGNTFGFKKISGATDEKVNKIVKYIVNNYDLFIMKDDFLKLKKK